MKKIQNLSFQNNVICYKDDRTVIFFSAYGLVGVNAGDNNMEFLYEHRPDDFRPLSETMIRMWTNFAKTGYIS